MIMDKTINIKYIVGLSILSVSLLITACDSTTSTAEQLSKAEQFSDEGKINEGIIEAKNVLQVEPENSKARYLLGKLYLLKGMAAEAQTQFERAKKTGIDTPDLRLKLLESFLLQRKYTDIIFDTREVAEQETNAELLTYRGLALMGQNKLEEAKETLQKALDMKPEFAKALIANATLSMQTGAREEAEVYLSKLETIDPKQIDIWLLRAAMNLSNNEPEQAIENYKAALAINEFNIQANFGVARTSLSLRKQDEAKKYIDQIKKRFPDNPVINYLYGILELQQGNREKAKDHLQKLLTAVPNHLETLLIMAQINFEDNQLQQATQMLTIFQNNLDNYLPAIKLSAAIKLKENKAKEAIFDLEPFLADNADDLQLLSLLGSAYLTIGDNSKGTQYLARAAELAPDQSYIQTQLALGQLQSGEVDLAIEGLESVVELNPDLLRAELTLILVHIRQGNLDVALESINRAIEKDPENPIFHNLRGAVYLSKKEIPTAQENFELALKKDPNYTTAINNLAQIEINKGNQAKAKEYFEQILSINENNEQALISLADVAIKENQIERGIEYLERARKGNKNAQRSRIMLGNYYINSNNITQADLIVNELDAFAAKQPDVMLLNAKLNVRKGNTDVAINIYKTLLEAQPKATQVHYLLGNALMQIRDDADAEKSLKQALALAPGNLSVMKSLTRLYAITKRHDEALIQAKAIQKQFPESNEGFALQGDLLAAKGDANKALALYEKAFSVNPSSLLAIKIAQSMRNIGDTAKATSYLSDWAEKQPKDSAAKSLLATWYHQANQLDESVKLYEEVLTLNPNNVAALNNLATIYGDKGDDRALKLSERAHELVPSDHDITDTLAWIVIQKGQFQRGLTLLSPVVEDAANQNPIILYHYAYALAEVGETEKSKKYLDIVMSSNTTVEGAEALRKKLENR